MTISRRENVIKMAMIPRPDALTRVQFSQLGVFRQDQDSSQGAILRVPLELQQRLSRTVY